MPRNTFILVLILAILVAIIVAAKATGFTYSPTALVPTPTPGSIEPTDIPDLTYSSADCGISFEYPASFTKIDNPQGGAIFSAGADSNETIAVTCQKQIPRPPLPLDKIETMPIGTVSAKLYHDGSAKDGTPIDKIIFTHPRTKLDVYIAGIGKEFQKVLSTLKVL